MERDAGKTDVSTLALGFGLRASGFGLRASGFGLRASGFGLRASGFGLRASGFGLRGVSTWGKLIWARLKGYSPEIAMG